MQIVMSVTIVGFICLLYITTVDALYYIMTSRVCCHFAILSDEIQALDENTTHRLRDIVKRHQYLLELSQNLEEIFRGPNFFNVLIGSLEICALGFSLTIGEWEQIPGVVLFLSSVFVQILMISVFGENLIRESTEIGEAAFRCKWYNMDKKSKNTILLIMIRAGYVCHYVPLNAYALYYKPKDPGRRSRIEPQETN
ncbi:unnamed protein product [Euphydryas editha]|uniref:Uncharacterized protein n=1 Tax=Euphydryas editha TaxID=104508 RepID=A0AAU9TL95_EUPED|nr:unnamed protein product [Euphydryas editha]